MNEEAVAQWGLLRQIKKMEAADSPETIVSASMIRLRSSIKQKKRFETSFNSFEIYDT